MISDSTGEARLRLFGSSLLKHSVLLQLLGRVKKVSFNWLKILITLLVLDVELVTWDFATGRHVAEPRSSSEVS